MGKIGKLEKEARQLRSRTNLRKTMLASIYTAGLLSLAVVAPNTIKLLKTYDKYRRKTDPRYGVKTALNGLIKQGYVELVETKKGKFVRLTKSGQSRLFQYTDGAIPLPKPRRWDKRWRVIIYDIREKRRPIREKLRNILSNFGFLKLQDSVWVYPYDCEDLVIMLKADMKVGKDILYVIAEKIENDKTMKDFFGLK